LKLWKNNQSMFLSHILNGRMWEVQTRIETTKMTVNEHNEFFR